MCATVLFGLLPNMLVRPGMSRVLSQRHVCDVSVHSKNVLLGLLFEVPFSGGFRQALSQSTIGEGCSDRMLTTCLNPLRGRKTGGGCHARGGREGNVTQKDWTWNAGMQDRVIEGCGDVRRARFLFFSLRGGAGQGRAGANWAGQKAAMQKDGKGGSERGRGGGAGREGTEWTRERVERAKLGGDRSQNGVNDAGREVSGMRQWRAVVQPRPRTHISTWEERAEGNISTTARERSPFSIYSDQEQTGKCGDSELAPQERTMGLGRLERRALHNFFEYVINDKKYTVTSKGNDRIVEDVEKKINAKRRGFSDSGGRGLSTSVGLQARDVEDTEVLWTESCSRGTDSDETELDSSTGLKKLRQQRSSTHAAGQDLEGVMLPGTEQRQRDNITHGRNICVGPAKEPVVSWRARPVGVGKRQLKQKLIRVAGARQCLCKHPGE